MAVSTFYPDADPETTSVDGELDQGGGSQSWTTKRGAAGTGAQPSAAQADTSIDSSSTANEYSDFARIILLFDTSSLPDGATKDSATLEVVGISPKLDQFVPAGSVSIVPSTPASNTNLVAGDYAQVGGSAPTKQATDRTIAGLLDDSATYNLFTLNAAGLASISLTSITKFGFRVTSDADNAEPTWASLKTQRYRVATADEILAEDKRPRLVVTHTPPPFTPRMLVF